jgi:hypothetical protein
MFTAPSGSFSTHFIGFNIFCPINPVMELRRRNAITGKKERRSRKYTNSYDANVIIIFMLLFFFGWVLSIRHFRALQAANIKLVKQEQQEAALLYQLGEVKEKNRKLEDKLRTVQYELYSAKQKEDHH